MSRSGLDARVLEDTPLATVADDLRRRYEIGGIRPGAVAQAGDATDVRRVLSYADAHQVSVGIVGGGTMLGLGTPPRAYDVALDLSGLDGVVAYEPDDFTVSVGAGMTLAELQGRLAVSGQYLPLDAGRFEAATVGGVVAVGRGGLRRAANGGPRDWLIGMRMVRADGTPIKGGGQVVKNVSGYDLPKLFSGSLGTLGAIVETTFKLRPLPAHDRVVAVDAGSLEQALAGAWAAAQAAPSLDGCLALSAASVASARSLGAEALGEGAALVLRASGLESAVEEVLSEALGAVRSAGVTGSERGTDAIVETWQAITDLELATPPSHLRLRLGVRPASLGAAQAVVASHWADAERWVAAADSGLLFVDVPHTDAAESAGRIEAARQELERVRAHLTVESAPPELKALVNVWGAAGAGARLMHRIKQEFDPNGILNPGRFVDGI